MDIINYLRRNNGSGHIVEHIGWHESGDYMLRLLFSSGNGYRMHKYEVEKEFQVVDKSEVEKLERQTCPRRIYEFGPWERTENIDYWQDRNGDRCCSFCGSYNPEDLIKLVEQHGMGIVENTTKSYKRYVRTPNNSMAKFYTVHLSNDQVDKMNEFVKKANSVT